MVLVENDEAEGIDPEDLIDGAQAEEERLERMQPTAEAEEGAEGDEREQQPLPCGVSRREKDLIKKLRVNLGHPSRQDFHRALRMSRARPEILAYVKREFHCDHCEEHQPPRSARPATIPKTYAPNRVVGVDVVFMPALNPRETKPVLNIVDWGTCYQALEPVEDMTSDAIWMSFLRGWVRTFGMPEMIAMDQGREFIGSFAQRASEYGGLVRTIGARAPWQNGRTERHGGLAKGIFIKTGNQVGIASAMDWEECLRSVEAAKNRLFNRSGYSPAQRQLGQNLRLPGTLGSDDPFEVGLIQGGANEEMSRTLEIRQAALEAFVRYTTEASLRKASQAKSRGTRTFVPGQIVYVYRKPLPRRGAAPAGTRACWCGPGTLIMLDGRNAWVSMKGELWKCAQEQMRLASSEEEEAMNLLKEEFDELKEQLRRGESKRGFKDISQWENPEEEEEPPAQRRRMEEPAPPGEEALPPASNEAGGGGSTVEEEPEQEMSENADEDSAINVRPEHLQEATESVVRNERLDGTLSRGRGAYEPIRRRLANIRWRPYEDELYVMDEDDEIPEELERTECHWQVDLKRRKLIFHHGENRTKLFHPSETRCPIPLSCLSSQRRTVRLHEDGSRTMCRGDWRRPKSSHEECGPVRDWVGYTEFHVKAKVNLEKYHQIWMAKKSSDEVREEDIPAEEWPQWRESDGAEWSKVAQTGAVVALSEEESLVIEKQLKEAGLSSRILPSKMVRRWKPSEQPGVPPSRKSRWCIRGDKDPDLLSLNRYAPTVTTAVVNVALQLAANRGFQTYVADLKNAFMPSGRLVRESGRLFCRQPKGGLPGLKPGQLIEIMAGAYGLGDAPAHWRKSVRGALLELGYEPSVMHRKE